MMYIYLDESGDLGFGQNSSKYFTIAFVVMSKPVQFGRCIRKVKIKCNIPRLEELKGSTTNPVIKRFLLSKIVGLDIEVHAITVKKKNVAVKLRRDANILYNYMVGLSLVERILEEPENTRVIINVDNRITSVTSGFKLNQYLQYKIWYERERQDIDLSINHLDSKQTYAIQGIDVICNSIYRKYNSNNSNLFNIIKDKIKCEKKLFFSK